MKIQFQINQLMSISALMISILVLVWIWIDNKKINNLKKEKLRLEIQILKYKLNENG